MELSHYIVQYPDSERELDALEIIEDFESYKLNTTSLLRPASGGE